MLGLAMVAVFFMLLPPCGCLCFSCHAWHVPTCRTPPGEGGAAKRKGRGISHPEQSGGRAKRRSAQAQRGRLLGNPLRCARAEPSAKVWFPYACASAHMIFRVALRQEQAAVEGGGRRAAAG